MLKRIPIALFVLFLISSFASGQNTQPRVSTTGAIQGGISLSNNQAIENYEILLLSKEGEQVYARTWTSISGRYQFLGVSPGLYDVVVRIEGFEEERATVTLGAGRTMIVNIIMTATAEQARYSLDSSVVNVAELGRKYSKKEVGDFQKAQDSRQKGDNARVIELLEEVVRTAPDFYEAHNLLGMAYQSLSRFRDAEKEFNLARNLNAKSTVPLVNLAALYLQEAEASEKEGPLVTNVMYDDSLHMLQAAVRLEPNNPTIFYLFGVGCYRHSSYRLAEVSLNQALNIDPHMGQARLALANVYIRQQKWKDALAQFDTYLSENPKAADRPQVESIRAKVVQQF